MPNSAQGNTTPLHGLDLESRQMVLDTIGQLRKKLLTKENILEWDKEEKFPEDAIRQMLSPDIGLQLFFIPEEYGGMGGGARDCCAVTREICKICLGVGTAFFAIQLGADPLIVGGTDAQKQRWLGAIAEGKTLVAYAVTEPNAGSNLAALTTKAEPITDAEGKVTAYRINGSKQFISTGGYADYVTLLAVAPEGPTFFVVEKTAPGFVRGKGEEKHGIRASNTSPLSFTDVVVPVENLIGGIPGQGLKQANKVFGYTRLMVAAMALGAGESALAIAITYAKERVQFGTTLSEKQGYTHKLIVPHAVRLEAAAAYIEETAERIDGGDLDLQVEGSIAKLFTSESANRTADDAMQALGGYGYIREFEVEKIKRDAKITCIYEGTSEVQQSIISTFRWKTTVKSKGGYYGAIADRLRALDQEVPETAARFYAWAASALNDAILLVHRHKLSKEQHLMFALADMMAHVEVGAALAHKAARAKSAGSADAERLLTASRIFAAEVARFVNDKALIILLGTGTVDSAVISEFLSKMAHAHLAGAVTHTVRDMDRMADILFGRASS